MKLQAEARNNVAKSETKRLRRENRVPGTVYGKSIPESVSVSVDSRDVDLLLRAEGRNAVFDLDVEGGETYHAMIGNLDRGILNREMLNIQFRALEAGQLITVNVPVELVGTEKILEGVVDQGLYELEIEVNMDEIPESFVVDISELTIGDVIRAEDIDIGSATLAVDPDTTVVSVVIPSAYEESTEEEEEDEAVGVVGEAEESEDEESEDEA